MSSSKSDTVSIVCLKVTVLPTRNQAEFPELLSQTLDCLTKFKRVGSLEVMMFYAFRNKADDVVSYQ